MEVMLPIGESERIKKENYIYEKVFKKKEGDYYEI